MRTRIFHPDYKQSGLGYTRLPTKIAEAPAKWGLTKNGLVVYLFLISRVKKKCWFNGKSLKCWMKGNLGETAVSSGLRNLVDTGFCTKVPNRKIDGTIAGWDYTFSAFPRERSLVNSVDPEVCLALDSTDWFDHNPESGKPDSGNASLKEKDMDRQEGIEEDKTPDPLHEEEGSSQNFFREVDSTTSVVEQTREPSEPRLSSASGPTSQSLKTSSPGTEVPEDLREPVDNQAHRTGLPVGGGTFASLCDSRAMPDSDEKGAGRWRNEMMKSEIGRRVLEILQPEQVPNDKSLRPISNRISKGEIKLDYLAFLEEMVILPNQKAAEAGRESLKSIPEILKFLKDPERNSGSVIFKNWKARRIRKAQSDWERVNREDPDGRIFREELAALVSLPYPIELRPPLQGRSSPPSEPPIYYFAALHRFKTGAGLVPSDPAQSIVQNLKNPEIWTFLLKEAELNHAEYQCLWSVVGEYGELLPSSYGPDITDLHSNWVERHSSRKKEIEYAFRSLGISPPTKDRAHADTG